MTSLLWGGYFILQQPRVLVQVLTLRWRHNERHGVSNHRRLDCLLNRLFRPRSKKTSKLRVTGLCAGNTPVTGEFPTQRASNAENVSIWWRHHEVAVGVGNARRSAITLWIRLKNKKPFGNIRNMGWHTFWAASLLRTISLWLNWLISSPIISLEIYTWHWRNLIYH